MFMQEILKLERLSDSGDAIARTGDGIVVFVRGGAPGDLACVDIDKQYSNYYKGHVAQILEASEQRVTPLCPHVGQCGGCSWQHISYPAQLQAKQQIVADALKRIAGFSEQRLEGLVGATRPSPREYHYRNKIVMAAATDLQEGLRLGFRLQASHAIAKPGRCLLAPEPVTGAPKALRGALRYAQGLEDLGLFSVSVRHSRRSSQTEVALWSRPGGFERSRVAQIVASAIKASSIVRVIANPDKPQQIKNVEVLSGNGSWLEKLAGLKYQISAPSFFQVNSDTAEILIQEVLAALSPENQLLAPGDNPPTKETQLIAESQPDSVRSLPTASNQATTNKTLRIADLYAGAGTFSLPLARAGHDVIAVESAGSSLRDLRRNAQLNNLELEIEGGDVARILPTLKNLDALVVDPPRSGLGSAVIGQIAQADPTRLVYVSCNPATWARDIARLEQAGYHLQSVKPIDQFPQTPHIELVSMCCRGTRFKHQQNTR
jgi:23S rRNA (uracil1939-C5)-methyltransferase